MNAPTGILAPQLADLVGMSYERFRNNLHRARMAFAWDPCTRVGSSDDPTAFLPFKDAKAINVSDRVRYSAADVLAVALAVEAAAAGMSWREACATVVLSDAAAVTLAWPPDADMRMVRMTYDDGMAMHFATTWSAVMQRWADREPASALCVDAGRVLRQVRERALAMGVAEALGFEPRGFE